jgi:lipopolysaccharide transport system ATP-binding protein
MSSEPAAIRVRGLSKAYQIYARPEDRLKQAIAPRMQRLIRRAPSAYFHNFWALRDVSFDIQKGQTAGIVGRNGSGKSTLLQLIGGVLHPSEGAVEVRGKVAALLELGTGFNPEFTGRENIHLYGAMQGFTPAQTASRMDAILDFADIGDFIDQPLKTYSSGMVVRLAFAAAININPDVLIIDEALAVGDELFQRKCFARLHQLQQGGCTILFVSHAAATVVELCTTALLLDRGELLMQGEPRRVIGSYQRLLYAPPERADEIRRNLLARRDLPPGVSSPVSTMSAPVDGEPPRFDPDLRPKSTITYEARGAEIQAPALLDAQARPVNRLWPGRQYTYTYRVRFDRSAANVRFGMLIKSMTGQELGGAVSADTAEHSLPFVERDAVCQVSFRFTCLLNPGLYFLNAGVTSFADGEETYLHRILDALAFRVAPSPRNIHNGYVAFDVTPEITVLP